MLMLLPACQSTECNAAETAGGIVPAMVFPIFPLAQTMTDNGDDTVTVAAEWIVRLAEYRIKIEALEKEYCALKMLYEAKQK